MGFMQKLEERRTHFDVLDFQKIKPVNDFLDSVLEALRLNNDAALSRKLGVGAPVISKLRYGHLSVNASLIIRIHEATGWSIADIKQKLGLPSLAQAA